MGSDYVSILDFDRSVKPLLGEWCWEVEWCNLTNLSLRFGEPRLEIIREPTTSTARGKWLQRMAARRVVSISGRWKIWVYVAKWRIIHLGECLGNESSSYSKKLKAFAYLQGQRLTDIRISSRTRATCFEFDLNTVLEVRRMRRRQNEDEEVWVLYERGGYMRFVLADGTFSRKMLG